MASTKKSDTSISEQQLQDRRAALRRLGIAAFTAPAALAILTSERAAAQTGPFAPSAGKVAPKGSGGFAPAP